MIERKNILIFFLHSLVSPPDIYFPSLSYLPRPLSPFLRNQAPFQAPISLLHIMDGSEVKGHPWNDTDTLL